MAKYTKAMNITSLLNAGSVFVRLVILAVWDSLLVMMEAGYYGAVISWTKRTQRRDGKKLNTRFQETGRRWHVHILPYTEHVTTSITL